MQSLARQEASNLPPVETVHVGLDETCSGILVPGMSIDPLGVNCPLPPSLDMIEHWGVIFAALLGMYSVYKRTTDIPALISVAEDSRSIGLKISLVLSF